MSTFAISAEHFVGIWQLAPSIEVVARALARPVGTVRRWERRLRRAGVRLKRLPLQVRPQLGAFATAQCPSRN